MRNFHRSNSSATSWFHWSVCCSKVRKLNAFGFVAPENEVGCADQAQARPDKVHFERLTHVEHGERDEQHQGNDFFDDLELAQGVKAVADAVRRNLQHILEPRDEPTHEDGDPQGVPSQIFQVGVPCEKHDDVRTREQEEKPERALQAREKHNKVV